MSSPTPGSPAARFPPGSRAHLLHAIALVALRAAIAGGGLLAARAYLGPDQGPLGGSRASFALLGIQAALVLVLGWLALLRFGRVSLRDLGFRDLSPGKVALGVAAFFPCLVCIASMLLAAGMTPPALLDAILAQPFPVRMLCLGAGIVAALADETLFRGYLQPALISRLGSALGVILTALLFAATHFPRSATQLVTWIFLGLIFGVLRGRDQPLWAPAIAHTLVWAVIGPM
ncbi:CPBP family intramembrane glutamic endopeptidase [Chondromyces apiculatus]|uniref:CAAX prenyl protease 2/Lysostaphin resistance protein A-like domain-containing protein n=1 Tax=Chondromyces apiculatus DSM 436 TaxID=1192034 RepID=A0A017SW82_9BACT|nr:type II CAAX endopeptidase family protein [Chondromyces apiculatus]EYF01229.1 Hypothetical protein CAP_8482 [Chondromyces apiculatus DSM 436]